VKTGKIILIIKIDRIERKNNETGKECMREWLSRAIRGKVT
jgi:hypothetical protein